MEKDENVLDNLVLELRRGTIVLSVLSQLKTPQYGYSLVASLEEKGFSVDSGTLYPLLRRLEKQGLLESNWEIDSAKPRKYYLLSDYGKTMYQNLANEWSNMVNIMEMLINEKE